MPPLTVALLAALPTASSTDSKDARVWRWVREQQGLLHEEEDVPGVEDESARIRSSFSDASSELEEPLKDDQPSAPVLTMDSLVGEIDSWLASKNFARQMLAQGSPTRLYGARESVMHVQSADAGATDPSRARKRAAASAVRRRRRLRRRPARS